MQQLCTLWPVFFNTTICQFSDCLPGSTIASDVLKIEDCIWAYEVAKTLLQLLLEGFQNEVDLAGITERIIEPHPLNIVINENASHVSRGVYFFNSQLEVVFARSASIQNLLVLPPGQGCCSERSPYLLKCKQ